MAPHSSVLAWRIPGMGEPGGLPSMGSHRVGHDWSDLAAVLVTHFNVNHVWLFSTLWTVACQAPLFMGFSRPEYWNGLPFPSPGDLPNPGIEPRSPALQTDSLPTELKEAPCYQSSRGEFATTEVDITNVCILMSIWIWNSMNFFFPFLLCFHHFSVDMKEFCVFKYCFSFSHLPFILLTVPTIKTFLIII